MRRSDIKRFIFITLVLVMVLSVYSPSALCASPSPSPTDSSTTSPSPSPTDSGTASTSPSPGDSSTTSPSGSASPSDSMLKQESKGLEVVRLQMRLRELGYFNYRATGNFFSVTKNSVIDFQKNNNLGSDGRIGQESYVKLYSTGDVARRKQSSNVTIAHGPTLASGETNKVKGQLGDWATINTAFPVSSTAAVKVTDCITGASFNVFRTGGVNIAEIEPATSADNDTYKTCYSGKAIWEKRAVVVSVNGTDYAASMFGNPSGSDTLPDNGMTGHTTLYFNGSRSDVSGFADKEDLRQVLIASGNTNPTSYK